MKAPNLLQRYASKLFLKEDEYMKKCPRCRGVGHMIEAAHHNYYRLWCFAWSTYTPAMDRRCYICNGVGKVIQQVGI